MATKSQSNLDKKKRWISRRSRRGHAFFVNTGVVGDFRRIRQSYKLVQVMKQELVQEKSADLVVGGKAARKTPATIPIATSEEYLVKAFDQESCSALRPYVSSAFPGLLHPKPIIGEVSAESPKKLPLQKYYKVSSGDDISELIKNYRFIYRKKWPEKEPTPDLSWAHRADSILDRLVDANATLDEISTAVLFAEVHPFDENQTTTLLVALRKFIEENRFTQVDEIVTVVGAAIRKFALNMKQSDFGTFAAWLIPSDTRRVHHETELELAKGALWRVKFAPLLGVEDFSQLIQVLRGTASDYLKRRLILDKNYASIARIAITATFAMEVWMKSIAESEKLRKLSVAMRLSWFLEAVDLEVRRVVDSVGSRDRQFAERLSDCWLRISTKDA